MAMQNPTEIVMNYFCLLGGPTIQTSIVFQIGKENQCLKWLVDMVDATPFAAGDPQG
jgi:hypothetical protein